MPTMKKRLNISLSDDLDLALTKLADRDQVPQATKATDLLRLALELEEDEIWDSVASKRDKKEARFLSHNKAWT
jgi:hypothetical protein